MVSEKKHLYKVSGGAIIRDYETTDCGDALKAFMDRIKHTKPLSGATIQVYHYVTIDDLIISVELIHRVVLI